MTVSELSVLDGSGDTRLRWNPKDKDEVQAARDKFDEFRKKGYAAFRVNATGTKGEQIDKFDPRAERVILMPPMVGG